MNDDLEVFGEDEYNAGSEIPNDSDEYADFDQAEAEDLEAGDAQEAQTAEVTAENGEEEYTPPAINLPMMPMVNGAEFTDDEMDSLNEMILNGQGAQAYALMAQRTQEALRQEMQRTMQAQVMQSTAYQEDERTFPELFKVHGSNIRQMASRIAPDQAGKPAARFTTWVAPFIAEVEAGADPVRTADRMARLLLRQTTQRTPEPAQPAPSARVAPAPSRGGSGATSLPAGRGDNDAKRFARRWNVTEEQARQMLNDTAINRRTN